MKFIENILNIADLLQLENIAMKRIIEKDRNAKVTISMVIDNLDPGDRDRFVQLLEMDLSSNLIEKETIVRSFYEIEDQKDNSDEQIGFY